ncbi:hypothetical protein [Mycobacteroides abscessus]|uniref:hypothetical protein n=1 Tax=Mycobacteroides abscessus TaxID=36809 RepID=UPI0009C55267|nr:hypothetical protein [Mycobacteroides abscessus]SKE91501.1 Bacteriophage protein [Mycobacteroides abscessus subsp. massiliense]
MTSGIPEWAQSIPSAPVHQERPNELTRPFTAQQLIEFGEQLIEQFLRRVVLAVVGSFIPGEGSFEQLEEWAHSIPIIGDIIEIIKDFLNGNSFPGVLSISRIANIIQDLIYGAGEFLTAESVTDNPYFDWDSVTPGFISGGSIRATANGTQQVLRTEPFEVFPGQTLELRAASQWTGASATAGSNPVKVGFTPFDADGNPLADVIRGSLQPSGDHGWQWIPVADKWPVPAGVKYVSQLLILDAGATAGTFRFSNASAWASNLLDLGLVKDLREMVDAIGGVANSEAANIEARLQAITADGKITVTEFEGLIQQAQVSGLAVMQTVINQILDILNGNIVTPINAAVQGIKDWFAQWFGGGSSSAIPLSQKGTANGVAALNASTKLATTYLETNVPNGVPKLTGAGKLDLTYVATGGAGQLMTLDGTAKVPGANMPDLSSTYMPLGWKGAANGVAPLNSNSVVPLSYLPPEVGGSGGSGSGNPYVMLWLPANQSLSNNTETTIAGWRQTGTTSVTFENASNIRFRFGLPGVWSVQMRVLWEYAGKTTGNRWAGLYRYIGYQINSGAINTIYTVVADGQVAGAGSLNSTPPCVTDQYTGRISDWNVSAAAGSDTHTAYFGDDDWFELRAIHNFGAALNVRGGPAPVGETSMVICTYLGAA